MSYDSLLVLKDFPSIKSFFFILSKKKSFFFLLSHRFSTQQRWRLIRFVRRGMRTGQALFPLKIELGIPRIRPWNEFLAPGG